MSGFFFNLGAQVSGFTNAHLAAALFFMAAVPVAWKTGRWVGKTHESKRRRLIFWSVVGLAAVIILALVALLAIFVTTSLSEPKIGEVGETLTKQQTAKEPNYVGAVRILGGVGDNGVARLEFKTNDYLDRLRIFVEFAGSTDMGSDVAIWGERRKIQIADLRDLAKGQVKVVSLAHESHNPGQKAAFWWGDPNVKKDDASTIIQRAKNRARVYFVGPDNKEQTIKLIAIKSAHDVMGVTMEGAPTLIFLDEKEVQSALDWQDQQ